MVCRLCCFGSSVGLVRSSVCWSICLASINSSARLSSVAPKPPASRARSSGVNALRKLSRSNNSSIFCCKYFSSVESTVVLWAIVVFWKGFSFRDTICNSWSSSFLVNTRTPNSGVMSSNGRPSVCFLPNVCMRRARVRSSDTK